MNDIIKIISDGLMVAIPVILITVTIVRSVIYNNANRYWESYWRTNLEFDGRWDAARDEEIANRLALRKLKLKVHSPMRKIITSVFLAALCIELLWYVPKFLGLASRWLEVHVK